MPQSPINFVNYSIKTKTRRVYKALSRYTRYDVMCTHYMTESGWTFGDGQTQEGGVSSKCQWYAAEDFSCEKWWRLWTHGVSGNVRSRRIPASVLTTLPARRDAIATPAMPGTASTIPVSGPSQTETLGTHLSVIMLHGKRAYHICGNNFHRKHI